MKAQIENSPELTCELSSSDKSTSNSDEPLDLGILLELGSIGAGHAATSLSDVIQQQIQIEVPKIQKIPPAALYERYKDQADSPKTAVYMNLDDSECDILLMFDLAESKRIAAMMTMAPSVEELDPAMEESAIQELANILIGSFLTAISDFTGVQLMPTTPQRVVDTLGAIMDNFIVKEAMQFEEALIFDTHFKRMNEDAILMLMLFPSPKLLKRLIQKSGERMGL
jgi:chemotaxis protein CheC